MRSHYRIFWVSDGFQNLKSTEPTFGIEYEILEMPEEFKNFMGEFKGTEEMRGLLFIPAKNSLIPNLSKVVKIKRKAQALKDPNKQMRPETLKEKGQGQQVGEDQKL